jgi:acyl-CoA reductase-like NAD-dependent aldehyde dehydrogenase
MGSAADVDRAVSGSSPHWLPPKWAPHRPLTAAKVAPALAAGNTVVLKPSEAAPLTTRAPAEIIADAGLPAGAFNLVSGDGPVVGHRIAAHPDVGLVSFTGSTAAGVQVSIAAAESIIAATVERFEVGDPTAESTNHGGREAARRRARGTGKPVAWLLRPADGVHEVAPDARIVREEVFGPVLVVQVYETVEKAVELANATEHGLSAGVWAPERPFGGYKRSGVGREYGRYGPEEFQEIKSFRLP